MITVFEFVELLYDIGKVLFHKIYKVKRRRTVTPKPSPSQDCLKMTITQQEKKKVAPLEKDDSGVFAGYYVGSFHT